MTQRPVVVVVVGTATDVGKTWVSAALIGELRARGRAVVARKPVQSFDPADARPIDAEVLSAATGEPPHEVCLPHRSLPVPMAPPMAADVLGRPRIELADLLGELAWPATADVVVVETAGGVRSPIAHDADSAAIAAAIAADGVVLVADAGLGTINAVRLAASALAGLRVVVVLNRFDGSDLHRRNADWLQADGLDVRTRLIDVADWIEHLR